jgi:hypothetical protein
METLILALPYYICAVAAWGTTGIVVLSAWKRLYPRRIIILGAATLLLGASFFLIAATAAPGGHVARAAVAWPIRVLDAGAGLLWLTWLAMAVRGAVRVEKRCPTGG